MKKVLLHKILYPIGGPNAVLDNITNSYLKEKFNFAYIYQDGGCGYNPFKALAFVIRNARLISKENADYILISGLHYVGFVMTLAAKFSNVKNIITCVHGSDWDVPERTLRKKILMHIIEPLEIRLADKIITVCHAEQQSLKALKCAKKGANRGVVYNTFPNIDYNSIRPNKLKNELNIPDGKIIVVTVGRVVYRKGHQSVIDAIKKMHDKDFVFVIIGDGDYLPHYKKECFNEIKNNQLFLLGKRDDVHELLKDADIFLFPTLNENHSIALLEAIAMRCAAIVTNVGGNTEIIKHDESGIVIPSEDPDAIIDALKRMKDPQKREKLADAAYRFASNRFSTENTLGKLEELFS